MQKVKNTMESKKYKERFLLVHGLCHGAWTWYKLKTQLEAAGHYVTVVDLAASGINMTSLEEIKTLKDYCKPLLDFLSSLCSDDEKVILVAHSMGGICAALAADVFPCKIAAVVFMTAFMPDTRNPPAYVYQKKKESQFRSRQIQQRFFCGFSQQCVLEKLVTSFTQEDWLDTVFGTYGEPDHPLEFALFGPNFMATNLYQLSPPEDLVLAKMLVRVNPIVTDNLAGTRSFSEDGYGSVTRVYIVCGEDLAIPEDYQRWMISNFPVKEVMEIKDADHMAMFCKPKELCALLLEVGNRYA